jgi:two-component system response regulator DevR
VKRNTTRTVLAHQIKLQGSSLTVIDDLLVIVVFDFRKVIYPERIGIMSKIVRLLIADDHAVVRKGLKALLEYKTGFKVVAEAATGMEAIEKAQASRPDVAILDIRMPGISGIEACRQISLSVKGCKIIMLTSYAEDELLFAAIQAGAAGYVLKQIAGVELVDAIERISSSEGVLDSAMTMSALKLLRKTADAQDDSEFAKLSRQEMTVLALLGKGMTNRQIAVSLYLGEGTVRNYVSTILAKLGLVNRAHAAAFAIHHKLDEFLARHGSDSS